MKKTVLPLILSIVIIGVLYYAMIPPINIQSMAFWEFLIICVVVVTVLFALPRMGEKGAEAIGNFRSFTFEDLFKKMQKGPAAGDEDDSHVVNFRSRSSKKEGKKKPRGKRSPLSVAVGIVVVIILIMVVGSVVSSAFFNAKSYSQLLSVEDGDFAKDISEISMSSVPVVDRDTAQRLGNKSIGEMSDLVSQYAIDESSGAYTQINYHDAPYRVSPLIYADIFKWITNTGKGLPGYVTVNMATQETKLVRLEPGNYMRYSTAEYFNRYLYRHLRFKYPTKIFDQAAFEIDEDGTPYWIVPTVKYRVALFGGKDYDGAILVNACTGETKLYDLDEVPNWCDKIFSADLVYNQLEYYGKYRSGFWNSLIGQSGVLCPTGTSVESLFSSDDSSESTETSTTGSGYNYLAIGDDVYMYTGMTSANSDQSLVGFVLVNLRTKATTYYTCTGAVESAAMSSAEGQVQQMKYVATSPLLLNIADRPTYFLSLKDGEGLVKMYAFIDVQRYQIVGTGSTVKSAQTAYVTALTSDSEVDVSADDVKGEDLELNEASGTIDAFESVVKEGNTYYYFKLKGDKNIYIAAISVSDALPFMDDGDKVSFLYSEKSKGVREVSKFQ